MIARRYNVSFQTSKVAASVATRLAGLMSAGRQPGRFETPEGWVWQGRIPVPPPVVVVETAVRHMMFVRQADVVHMLRQRGNLLVGFGPRKLTPAAPGARNRIHVTMT